MGEPHRYFSILEAIAGGRTRQNDIAQAAGLAASSIPFYRGTLRELGLVERIVPATEEQPHKSKRGRYQILDTYFRFWFRFVYPNRSLLERGETAQVRRQVEKLMDQFAGPAFEAICHEYIWGLSASNQLGFLPGAVGRWWDARVEIDALAVADHDVLFGECKWSTRPVGIDVLEGLRRKGAVLLQRRAWPRVRYALFSRSGFTPAVAAQADAGGVLLFDLDALVR